jgi:hypothetical protein
MECCKNQIKLQLCLFFEVLLSSRGVGGLLAIDDESEGQFDLDELK